MRGIKVPVEGPLTEVETTDVSGLFASQMAKRVRIGDVQTRRPFYEMYMYVDEEGCWYDLADNERASILYGTKVHGGRILGDAYLFGEQWITEGEDIGPDIGPLPEDITIEKVLAYIERDDSSGLR